MIEISVYETFKDFASNMRTFCRRFDETVISVPWDSIVMAFRAIFGNAAIINFTMML